MVPMRAREMAWRGVVEAALMSLLRGFSRVERCSTEGRALMSMDLQVGGLPIGCAVACGDGLDAQRLKLGGKKGRKKRCFERQDALAI